MAIGWNPAMLPGYDDEPTPEQLAEYRARLRKMSDAQLIREGKMVRTCALPKRILADHPAGAISPMSSGRESASLN